MGRKGNVMEKKYSCYGDSCRRCLYQPQISGTMSTEPGVNIGCDDPRHKLSTTTPSGFEIAHWIGQPDKKVLHGRGKRVI